MRLPRVARRHRPRQRVLLALLRLLGGERPPDVVRMLLYRPEFFGRPFAAWLQAVMRGPSAWSVGERELFAAFTSHLNRCRYCVGDHSAASARALQDAALVEAVLQDWRAAPLAPKTKAMLGLLERLTLQPQALAPQDMAAARAAGLSDAAIEDAINVCALFTVLNRLADALAFDVPGPEAFARHGRLLLRFGYRF
jgi:uncharacterized peroxidase-related enzyme